MKKATTNVNNSSCYGYAGPVGGGRSKEPVEETGPPGCQSPLNGLGKKIKSILLPIAGAALLALTPLIFGGCPQEPDNAPETTIQKEFKYMIDGVEFTFENQTNVDVSKYTDLINQKLVALIGGKAIAFNSGMEYLKNHGSKVKLIIANKDAYTYRGGVWAIDANTGAISYEDMILEDELDIRDMVVALLYVIKGTEEEKQVVSLGKKFDTAKQVVKISRGHAGVSVTSLIS